MFDIQELLVICVVALVVVGPERLPGLIRTIGLWVGRLRRSFNTIKADIEREIGADEIRRQLRNEAIMEKFKNTQNQVADSINSIKKEAESVTRDLNLEKQPDPGSEDGNTETEVPGETGSTPAETSSGASSEETGGTSSSGAETGAADSEQETGSTDTATEPDNLSRTSEQK